VFESDSIKCKTLFYFLPRPIPFLSTKRPRKLFPRTIFLAPARFPAPGPIQPSAIPSLPVSPPGGPCLSGASPSPDRAGLKLRVRLDPARAAAPPLGPARQGPRSAPIKGTLDPLDILNRTRSRRLRQNLASAPPPLLELGVLRDAAVPTRPCRLQALQEFRTEVVRLTGLFFFSFSLRFARFSSPAPPLRHAPPHGRSTRLCPAQAPPSSSHARARAPSPRTEPKRAQMAVLANSGVPPPRAAASARRRSPTPPRAAASARCRSPTPPPACPEEP